MHLKIAEGIIRRRTTIIDCYILTGKGSIKVGSLSHEKFHGNLNQIKKMVGRFEQPAYFFFQSYGVIIDI